VTRDTHTTRDDNAGDASAESAALYTAREDEAMIQFQMRIPQGLKRLIEREAERLTERYGVPVSVSGVIRKLVTDGLVRARKQEAK